MKILIQLWRNSRFVVPVLFCSLLFFQKSGWAGASAQEIQQWLDTHNQFRAQHQVGPVAWSDTVAASAQAFADKCPTGHSGSGYGENMGWGYPSITSVVTAWYQEEKFYDYSNPEYSDKTGHFTQVVWKGTTEIGCALKTECSGWSTTWVCQYNPPGNYRGLFAENVFPKKAAAVPSAPRNLSVVPNAD